MKSPKPMSNKSLLKSIAGSRDPSKSPFPRSLYKSQFDKMIKGGMSPKEAGKTIRKIMQDDMRREIQEYNY